MRGYKTLAKKALKASVVYGQGPWASVTMCRPKWITVYLHRTQKKATLSLVQCDWNGCGGVCRHDQATNTTHRLIDFSTGIGRPVLYRKEDLSGT